MRTHLVPGAIAALLATLAAPAAAIDEYRLDDGIKEQGMGITTTGNNSFAWLQRFVVQPGRETLTAIRIAFGGNSAVNSIPNGSLIDLYIWDDPNQDGDPSDAFFVGHAFGTVANSGTQTLNTYMLQSPVTLPVGRLFFAGAIADYMGPLFVGSLDLDGTDAPPTYPPSLHSYMAADARVGFSVDPNALGLAQSPVVAVGQVAGLLDGNWLIRVNAQLSGSALDIHPYPLDFGTIPVGSVSATEFVTLSSAGTLDVTVTSIDVPGIPYQTAPGGTCATTPFTLPPGVACTLAYQFTALHLGPHPIMMLAVHSTDPISPQHIILTGSGGQMPDPVFIPAGLDMGQIDIDSASSMTVQLLNQGNGDLNVQNLVELSPPEPAFTYTNGTCGPFPLLLLPGGTCDIDVTFQPTRHGNHGLILGLMSNAPPGTGILQIRGIGTLFQNGFD